MYRNIRNIHLLLGLFCFAFLLMYSVSAVEMAHSDWFPDEPTVTEESVAIDPIVAANPRALAQMLMQSGRWGELQSVNKDDEGFTVRIVRPGTSYQVRYRAGGSTVQIETSVSGTMRMLNRLHHLAGFYREQTVTHWWAAFAGFASLALLLLGASGVYLWFRTYSERLVGGLILSLGLIVGVGLLIATRLQS